MSKVDKGKRELLVKAAYVTPAIVTMTAIPSFASAGSGWTGPSSNPPGIPGQSNFRGRQRGQSQGTSGRFRSNSN